LSTMAGGLVGFIGHELCHGLAGSGNDYLFSSFSLFNELGKLRFRFMYVGYAHARISQLSGGQICLSLA
jgi:hypothetical protein